ncbi:hypothetical protein CLAFUW4_03343 [Fulvia fulva]|uniref:Myb-like domain-containing protein n=1 Tax=Passalora fulva TaxID=5499 RepID=A0A9Q8LAE0_PASFU|nr:uncharacterized protein CLAFUR5_03323 [Fulvia fulva]KAK4631906.1 hypothetical protein CLAFUR4_03332 [Fulvia fulva]KAK4633262.1 hypothetical protein CLAFUR0_03337 [Fulvia fulva]UJO13737.1 hypothetical protein CLAFUR5_03323 [Fulvia fulva]WPV11303.1 hypothetical protein CLAFUW4_03343 [Fulvia fulva]WPV26251.1 hypothetical protein CLAFUW7_03335 [Fulvia fulva]
MATPPEQPWSSHEKNYLLAEIIKAAHPPPDVLLNLLRSMNIQPRWDEIPLPPGRSLNSCRYAFDELRRSLSMQQQIAAPNISTPLSAPVSLKRPFQYEGPYSAGPSGREIRPKPSLALPTYSQPSPTEPPPKRKRGRPTKAEAQAKAEAAAALSGGDPGPLSATTASRPSTSTSTPAPMAVTITSAPTAEAKLPPATRMPIAAMLTPSAGEPKSASHSSSSSGKRRHARSTKDEPEGSPTARAGTGYDSPYVRAAGTTEDSPARTAVLRHRPGDLTNPPRFAPSETAAEANREA